MCLSTVYKIRDNEKEKVCEYVSGVENRDGVLIFTDVMGDETEVDGTLLSMDFVKNEILIGE